MSSKRKDEDQPHSESGIALIEFATTIPFLVMLTTAMIDTAGLLSQYVVLTNAVHAGLRAASSVPNLETGDNFQAQSSGQGGCSKVGNATFHAQVQEIVQDLVEEKSRWIEPNSLCITTGAFRGGAAFGTPQDNTVFVRVRARYQGFFPGLDQLEFAVESSAPLL